MKITVQKNHLGTQILYRSLDRSKKTASITFFDLESPENVARKQWETFLKQQKLKLLKVKKFFFQNCQKALKSSHTAAITSLC